MSKKKEGRRKESWKAADVKCPFYIKDNHSTIECEGFLDGTTEILRFPYTTDKNKHMGIYCVGKYNNCSRYQNTMNNKYPD